MKDCDNFVCTGSDGTKVNANENCPVDECMGEKCRVFNDCDFCENQNTCAKYNN